MQLRAVEKSVPRDYVRQKFVFIKVEVNIFVHLLNKYSELNPYPNPLNYQSNNSLYAYGQPYAYGQIYAYGQTYAYRYLPMLIYISMTSKICSIYKHLCPQFFSYFSLFYFISYTILTLYSTI